MRKKLYSLALLMCMSVATTFAATIDRTDSVATDYSSWGGQRTYTAGSVTLVEYYDTSSSSTIGTIMSQTVTGLENGTYTVELYANSCDAWLSSSTVTDGDTTVAYVFAGDQKKAIPVYNLGTITTSGEYTIENVTVSDGTLTIGLGKSGTGTEWHTIQIKSLKQTVDSYTAMSAALTSAQAVNQTASMSTSALANLKSAISTASALTESSTETELDNATTALTDATAAANTSIASTAIVGSTITDGDTSNWTHTSTATFSLNSWSHETDEVFATNYIQEWQASSSGGLGTQTTTYTLEGLEPGTYTATVSLRSVSEAGSAQSEGQVTVALNGGTSKDVVADGSAYSYGSWTTYYGTFTLAGTVGEDETLKLVISYNETPANFMAIKGLSIASHGTSSIEKALYDVVLETANTALTSINTNYSKATAATDLAAAINTDVTSMDSAAVVAQTETLTSLTKAANEFVVAYDALGAALKKYTTRSALGLGDFEAGATAQTGFDACTLTTEEATAYPATLQEAYRTYLRALDSSAISAKAYQAQTDFASGSTILWSTTTGASNNQLNNNHGTSDDYTGSYNWENWDPSAFSGNMYLTVTGLPSGKYFFRVAAGGNTYSATEEYAYITSGENSATQVLTSESILPLITVTDPIEVTNGEVEIGVHYETSNWAAINAAYLYAAEIYDVTRETATDSYGTICLPYAATVTGATLYTAAISSDGTAVELTEASALEAGVAYIYQATAATQTFSYASGDLIATATEATSGLQGVFAETSATAGTYVLQDQGDGQKFYAVENDADVTVPAYKAYLLAPASEAKELRIIGAGDATGINAVEAVSSLLDGSAKIYDLSGKQLKSLQKGINIVNGVKVVVK